MAALNTKNFIPKKFITEEQKVAMINARYKMNVKLLKKLKTTALIMIFIAQVERYKGIKR